MKLRIMTEASGSLTTGYLIKAIREAGHESVASDIDASCFGRYLADDFLPMPRKSDPALWQVVEKTLVDGRIDVVIPSLDETLPGWAERKEHFGRLGVHVVVSPASTISVCRDKWLTYGFFRENGIPTPKTSLDQEYPLVKPRDGRGGTGVEVASRAVDMEGKISQELLAGVEYTVDVFCDRDSAPVYIVPRRRLDVREGKSTGGIVEENAEIARLVREICRKLPFVGPVNMQCFVLGDGSVKFVEINPRIAGGMALGFAASENWIRPIVDNLVRGIGIVPVPVRYGMEMKRYYAEIFVPPH